MKSVRMMILAAVVATMFTVPAEAQAQECFLGEVRMFAGNFAPRGWALCDGQLLAISKYSAVFSLLGTMYGGDGRTTFALPDLRGRVPLHSGTGPGLLAVKQGSKRGQGTAKVAEGETEIKTSEPSLGFNYIICLQGTFPSRN
jgi:microcystin-dependent protein